MKRTKRTRVIVSSLLAGMFCMLASSCYLDRSGLREWAPELTATPVYFCPGETVTLKWDMPVLDECDETHYDTDDNCSRAEQIEPLDLAGRIRPQVPEGTIQVRPPGDTNFVLVAHIASPRGRGRAMATALVHEINGIGSFQGLMPGGCRQYGSLSLENQLSACLFITRVCLPDELRAGQYSLIATKPDDSRYREVPFSGRCADVGNLYRQGVKELSLAFMPAEPFGSSGDCSVEGGDWLPSLNLDIHLQCDSTLPNCQLAGGGVSRGGKR